MQRYKFESDSQHIRIVLPKILCCVYLCKDTNLKAIHNGWLHEVILHQVVSTYAKIQIWKRFTTPLIDSSFENSCVYLCKDTNLKAIHNLMNGVTLTNWLCLPMQRYKFESDSQLGVYCFLTLMSCVYLCKDTNLKAIHNAYSSHTSHRHVVSTYAKIQIWKRFTTCAGDGYRRAWLCLPMQRYKFESDSQR